MEKIEYFERLRRVKEVLPKYYGVIVRSKHPNVKATTLYNVVDKDVYNVTVLLAMEDTFKDQLITQ